MRSLLAIVVAVALSSQAPAAGRLALQEARSDAEFRRSVGTTAGVVHIDVIAADTADRAVDNLEAADFDLREDGTLQSIDDVRFVRVDGAAAGDELRAERARHTPGKPQQGAQDDRSGQRWVPAHGASSWLRAPADV